MEFVFNCKFCGKPVGMVYTLKNKLIAVELDSLNDIEKRILTSSYKWGLTFEKGKHKIHFCKEKKGR